MQPPAELTTNKYIKNIYYSRDAHEDQDPQRQPTTDDSPDLFPNKTDTDDDTFFNNWANNDPSLHFLPNNRFQHARYGTTDCYLDFILTINRETHQRKIYKLLFTTPERTSSPEGDPDTINLWLDYQSLPRSVTYHLTNHQFTLPSELTWTYIEKFPDQRVLFIITRKKNDHND